MDITIQYKPHYAQSLIHEACDNDDYKFITCNTSRQFGKTKLLSIQAIKWALQAPNLLIWIVLPTDGQALKIAQGIMGPLQESGIVKTKSETLGSISITFLNKSKIQFKSARSEDNLRGNTLDYLIIDEAAFIKESVFQNILLPMIITKKSSRVLICSTPKGRTNWFYTQYMKKGDIYKSFKFTYKDNPMVDMDIIDEFKKSYPEDFFKQEFLAEFIDASQLFSNIEQCEIENHLISESDIYYGGIDLGMKNDFSVFSVVNEFGELVYQDSFTGLEVGALIDRLDETFKKYNFQRVYVEDNSFGIAIVQLLRERWFEKVKPFNTNVKTKSNIISNLISAFSQKLIKFTTNDELVSELCDFGYKVTNSGAITYSAISGHDDRVMSLAIAWECFNKRHLSAEVPIQF